ncbi:hypothetical protein [Chromobacterium violaceum]|uniref:hypothetical protein n=1 Tax=Chromobacterium violaceum TaxID=536 RepID=UPI001B31DAE7|nr:hypothetical protein [Chromobacterium violaceum]MBP4044865.1 hypothetical protein [Chromobacterium violaceum]
MKALIPIAPWLAHALGSIFSSQALMEIGKALDLADPTEVAIEKICANLTNEQINKLQQADQTFSQQLKEIGFLNYRQLIDLKQSDKRTIRKKPTKLSDKTPRNLAYILVVGMLVVGSSMLFIDLKVDSSLAGVILGYLFNSTATAINYYFGEREN